jgi:tRNA-specific 2-thiouridylase
MTKRVVVGMSGGVDSSVAAYLLKEQGYDVIGLFMKNWHNTDVTISDECPWEEDSKDAMLVAEKLGIPFQAIDLSEQYKERIVDYMFSEYEAGRTPNPDVLCNREIKFDVFLDAALKLGADYVATGHYCRKGEIKVDGKAVCQLKAGKDGNKDQSYFLCQVNQEQLKYALFPIGELEKPEVRKIAHDQDLITAEKKDSQGLCFIGKVRLPEFLQQKLKPLKGDILEIPREKYQKSQSEELVDICQRVDFASTDGEVVGKHNGAHYYTVGQRKGLNVGGKELPLFVLQIDVKNNLVYTGQGDDHPALLSKGLFVKNDEVHWVREDLKMTAGQNRDYQARIRYRQTLVECTLCQREEGLFIVFADDMRAIAPGQFVAWYDGDELIGSGVISE